MLFGSCVSLLGCLQCATTRGLKPQKCLLSVGGQLLPGREGRESEDGASLQLPGLAVEKCSLSNPRRATEEQAWAWTTCHQTGAHRACVGAPPAVRRLCPQHSACWEGDRSNRGACRLAGGQDPACGQLPRTAGLASFFLSEAQLP